MDAADVNLATERARVVYDPAAADLPQLRAAVERAGYRVGEVPAAPAAPVALATTPAARAAPERPDAGAPAADRQEQARPREIDDLRRKWTVALPVGLAMMALMYVPLPLDAMDVLMPALLVVATVIQFWAGGGFYRAAWAAR